MTRGTVRARRGLALIACAAATMPAAAQAPAAAAAAPGGSSVSIYGILTPMVDVTRISGASAVAPANRPSMLAATAYTGNGNGRVVAMQSSTSNLGFRGTENLGGGLNVFFQLEHGLAVDSGAITGPPGSTRFWNRNSAVGFRGGFGSVFFGIWDTPIAWSHLGLTNGVRNPYAGDSSVTFVTPGFNIAHPGVLDARTNSALDAIFNRRQGNSVQYWSPNLAGFSFRLAYSLPEGEKTAANGAKYSPTVLGVGTEYAAGKLLVRYVWQQHADYFGLAWLGPNPAANPDSAGSTANSSKDVAHRLIARWSFTPMWSLQGTFDRQTFAADNVAAGRMQRYSRDAAAVLLLMRSNPHVAWASYGQAADGRCSLAGGAVCSTNRLGASSWALGYRYDFSRRTDVFVSAYQVKNRANGQYGVFPRPIVGIAPGATYNAVTAGIEHSF
jgi:predicted porin